MSLNHQQRNAVTNAAKNLPTTAPVTVPQMEYLLGLMSAIDIQGSSKARTPDEWFTVLKLQNQQNLQLGTDQLVGLQSLLDGLVKTQTVEKVGDKYKINQAGWAAWGSFNG